MLQELSARFSKIIEQKRLKKKIEQDLHATKTELRDKTVRLASLKNQLDKEKVDVEKLERMNLTTLFYLMLGSREQQLEKEHQELLTAQLLYQHNKHQVEFLEQELSNLLHQLDNLKNVDSEYGLLLSEKERFLQQSNQAIASELLVYSEQIANLNSEVKEIKDAIIAGNNVILVLEQVIESLESAENWGTWDMLGGGLIITAIKHSKIDDARSGIDDVQIKMSQFTRELADVQKSIDLEINIGELSSFVDYFFDSLILDWIVQAKIVDSLEKSKQAKKTISQVVKQLENLERISQDNIGDSQEKRALLIERT